MPLYHCSPIWLEPGAIIRPGNYGRVLRVGGPRHSHWLRESFLEFVRKQEFPDKPSRLTSAFACENLDAARLFKDQNCQTGIIYEVEITDPKAPRHEADFNCIQPIAGHIDDMADVARHYWAASYWFKIDGRPGLKCAETLVESGLRIVAEAQ